MNEYQQVRKKSLILITSRGIKIYKNLSTAVGTIGKTLEEGYVYCDGSRLGVQKFSPRCVPADIYTARAN